MQYTRFNSRLFQTWMWAISIATLLAASTAPAMTTNVVVAPGGSLSFSPASVTIQVGDSVTWTWQGNGHNVTCDNPFESFNLDPRCGSSSGAPFGTQSVPFNFTFTYTNAGTFQYYCEPHVSFGMRGQVIVQSGPPTPPTVTLTSPANNVTNSAPTTVVLSATASGNGGNTITMVEFFDESTLVGTATVSPYSVTLSPVNGGIYIFSARATDGTGLSTTTPAVTNYIRGAVITPISLPDGEFQFTLNALNPAKTNMIEFSTDLITWNVLTNFLPNSTNVVVTDGTSISQPFRFYRHSVLR